MDSASGGSGSGEAAAAAEGGPALFPEFFHGPFVRSDMSEVPTEEVTSCMLIGVLFAASWCTPSRQFAQVLAEGYRKIRQQHGARSFEVVLVPRERTNTDWEDFFYSLPWLSLRWGDKLVDRLKALYQIAKLPRLLIVDRHGKVISANARGGTGFGFMCDPLQAYLGFMKKSGQVLPKAGGGDGTGHGKAHVAVTAQEEEDDSDDDFG